MLLRYFGLWEFFISLLLLQAWYILVLFNLAPGVHMNSHFASRYSELNQFHCVGQSMQHSEPVAYTHDTAM